MPITMIQLSGSANGEQINITDTATAGQTIHICDASSTERLFLWAVNDGSVTVNLHLELGNAGQNVTTTIFPNGGEQEVLCGFVNFSAATVIAAYADTTTVISIHGYVLQES